jgi:hypothetical protein
MKTKLIITTLCLTVLITACKKKTTNTATTTATTTSAYVSPLTGTWVNSADITDHFRINDTTWATCNGCYHTLIVNGAGKYLGNSNHEIVYRDTMMMNAPGLQRSYMDINNVAYIDYLYYTGGVIKIQINGYPTAGTNTTRIFNKQ